MTPEALAGAIDLTLLKPDCAAKDIEALAASAKRFPFAALCVPPCHVALAARLVKGSAVKVATVAGFPLGYQARGIKLAEAVQSAGEGADEIDMVMNVSLFKSGRHAEAEEEIASMVKALPGKTVKVIIETCFLNLREKLEALEICVNGGAHFVKTSTGFGPSGATVEDVRMLKEAARGRLKVKASGGIKGLGDALAMIGAGANRLGTSAGVSIVEEFIGSKKMT